MLPGTDGIDVCRQIRGESGVLDRHADGQDRHGGRGSSGLSRARTTTYSPFKSRSWSPGSRRGQPDGRPGAGECCEIGDEVAIDVAGHSVKRSGETLSLTLLEVRPAGRARAQAAPGLHPRGAARAGLGLPPRGRHPAGERARAAAAGEDREGPRAPRDRGDGARGGIQGGDLADRRMEWSAVNSDAVEPAACAGCRRARAIRLPRLGSRIGARSCPRSKPALDPRREHREQREQRDVRAAWEKALRRKKWVRWIVSWLPHRLTIGVRSLLRLQHLVVAKVRVPLAPVSAAARGGDHAGDLGRDNQAKSSVSFSPSRSPRAWCSTPRARPRPRCWPG